jgi:transcriptional regulator with XRE-family HTH domain
MTLGENINRCRKRKSLSQEQLAEKVGVSRQAVSKWELNEAQPEIEKLIALAKALEVSSDMLLGLREEEIEGTELHPDQDNLGTIIRFTRRIWYNIGYFLLIWGAAIATMALGLALLWKQMPAVLTQSAFFTGLVSLICGAVIVLFRKRRKP